MTFGWNSTNSQGDAASFNNYYAATTSFLWYQRTSNSVTNQIMKLGTDGSLYLGTGAAQVATQSFVSASYAPLASPALTGTPTAPTATAGTNNTQVATTAFVANAVAGGSGGGITNSKSIINALIFG